MATQLYSVLKVAVRGALLAEHVSASVRRMTGAQVIKTVGRGFAGVSPGANYCEIDIDEAVPSTQFDIDPGPFMKALEPVEVQIQMGGSVFVSKGFIIEDSFKGGVDSPSGISFKFIGEFPDAA